jgi:hypothetical protein
MTTRTPKDEAFAQKMINLLDLSADADDETILAAIDQRTSKIAGAEVAAAVKDGRILAAHRDYWAGAFKANYSGTRNVLASLTPTITATAAAAARASTARPIPQTPAPPPKPAAKVSDQTLADAEADAELWKMGFRDGVEAPPKPGWWELFPPEQVY